jgi:hypothetical protein
MKTEAPKRHQNPTLQLPAERLAQLKELAVVFGGSTPATLSETIGNLISLARDQGLIDHGIPGIQLHCLSDGLVMNFDGGQPTELSFSGARMMSTQVRNYLSGVKVELEPESDTIFEVAGKGGNAVVVKFGGIEKVLSRDVAKDFADLIETSVNGRTG